jgi:hypothetical protein
MGQWNLGLLARAQLWPSFIPIPASSLGKCAYFGDEESVELTRLRIRKSVKVQSLEKVLLIRSFQQLARSIHPHQLL